MEPGHPDHGAPKRWGSVLGGERVARHPRRHDRDPRRAPRADHLRPVWRPLTFAPFGVPERQSSFSVDPERIVISNTSGDILDERYDPRGSFPSEFDPRSTPWDAVQVAYFMSYAVWNYLTAPFVFTYPDVEAKEIDPWQEAGETWRRLAVTFPPSNANHNPDQIFYYDEKYMQRRLDYSPQVTGRLPIAHYTHDPKTFDGFVFPTRRLVHRHDQHGIADQSLAVITLDLDDITVTGP